MKPTGLRALLPELNENQHKLLQRYIAEQRIAELTEARRWHIKSGWYEQRIAQLKKEAGI